MSLFKRKSPKYLYHATYPDKVESIKEHGIVNTFNYEGLVYLCASIEDIKQFTHNGINRWAYRVSLSNAESIIDNEGMEHTLPTVTHFDKVAIFKIDASKLNQDDIAKGDDHNINFYTAKVYTYGGTIPPNLIEEITYLPF